MNRLILLFAELFLVTLGALRMDPPADLTNAPKKEVKHEAKHINWLTIEEAYKLTQKKPKKFVIDVYTDWCGWCKVMDQKTFSKPAIIDYVNENFYAVRFNAEQTAPITLGQQTFKYVGSGGRGVHELAAALMKNQMSYPTTVFMDEKFNLIQPIPGYMEPRTFHQIITYFGGNNYQKEPFDRFKTATYAKEYQASLTAEK